MENRAVGSSPSSCAVVVANVSKRFGARTVLNGVNLEIPAGATVALLGPSGGGKSTLLRCLNGLNDFDSGEIRIGPHILRPGRAANGAALPLVRRLFGMIFQDFQLFPHLSVLDNVMEAPVQVLRLGRDDARARAVRLLQRVGMAGHLAAYPQQLSGGQKQRVAIARAILRDPKILILDDALASVDTITEERILQGLADIMRGRTTILISHRISTVQNASHIFVIEHGQVAEQGTHSELIRTGGYYADLYQKQLLEEELEAI